MTRRKCMSYVGNETGISQGRGNHVEETTLFSSAGGMGSHSK